MLYPQNTLRGIRAG